MLQRKMIALIFLVSMLLTETALALYVPCPVGVTGTFKNYSMTNPIVKSPPNYAWTYYSPTTQTSVVLKGANTQPVTINAPPNPCTQLTCQVYPTPSSAKANSASIVMLQFSMCAPANAQNCYSTAGGWNCN